MIFESLVPVPENHNLHDMNRLSPISESSSIFSSVLDSGAKDNAAATTSTSRSNPANMGDFQGKSPGKFRTGRWTLDEKILFLFGLKKFGKGRWKKISIYLPNRSLIQIKSHAQKVLTRQNAGEDVYRRMEENQKRLEFLVAEAHLRVNLSVSTADFKRKRKSKRNIRAATGTATNSKNNCGGNSISKTTTIHRPSHPTTIRNDNKKSCIAVPLCAPSSDVSKRLEQVQDVQEHGQLPTFKENFMWPANVESKTDYHEDIFFHETDLDFVDFCADLCFTEGWHDYSL